MQINRHPVPDDHKTIELNCFSAMNEDMDYSFFVPADQVEAATTALLTGDRAWWDDEGEGEWWGVPHPECLEMHLMNANIPYTIRHNGEDGRKEN